MRNGDQDVEQVLADLKARLSRMETKPPAELTPLQKAIAEVNANWHLDGRLRPPENASRAWYLSHFARRVARRVMVDLLNSIVEQQNAFNAQVARALTELAKENAELRAKVEELQKRGNA
jgi:ABC-type Zn2+ transport system substrate-binding protein/surface adhesin